jgi:teichuronic acid biosynthesis glycosyltransferase TuaC
VSDNHRRNAPVPIRALWTHNFAPERPNSLVFIDIAADGLRACGVDVHLEYLGNLRSLTGLAAARKRVTAMTKGFDLVHAQYGSACALATAGAKGLPKIVSVRGNDWNVHSESRGFLYVHTRLARAMTRWSVGSYDCVLPVSSRMAAELSAFAPGSRIETVPSPVDRERFVVRDKLEARAQLGYPGSTDKWVLFNALNLDDPIKRFPLAKAAFELANARCGNLSLRLAHGLPHEALPLLVAACDVILCTSETEGWPNSVKEALACNVPFVATDVSDLREIARQEPTCRICIPEAATIAQSLCEVLASPERPDLRRHIASMSREASSLQLKDIYESLLARSCDTARTSLRPGN